ncbi:MAG: hypothetical protein KAR20_07575 [Candidatus Heimdallarchaeota archaeon]|nr:hypothetical protein [Candidatus Heimdallarchaeota archaeon]
MDWEQLRSKFFNECVDSGGYVKESKINMTPHNLFEWFKEELTKNNNQQ